MDEWKKNHTMFVSSLSCSNYGNIIVSSLSPLLCQHSDGIQWMVDILVTGQEQGQSSARL